MTTQDIISCVGFAVRWVEWIERGSILPLLLWHGSGNSDLGDRQILVENIDPIID